MDCGCIYRKEKLEIMTNKEIIKVYKNLNQWEYIQEGVVETQNLVRARNNSLY